METQHQQVADRGVHSVTKRADFLALGVGSIGMLCIVLLPLLVISLFNHSYADDWHYGVWAHLALQQSGGNVGAALAEALRQVVVAWFDWQGTYSAIFLGKCLHSERLACSCFAGWVYVLFCTCRHAAVFVRSQLCLVKCGIGSAYHTDIAATKPGRGHLLVQQRFVLHGLSCIAAFAYWVCYPNYGCR